MKFIEFNKQLVNIDHVVNIWLDNKSVKCELNGGLCGHEVLTELYRNEEEAKVRYNEIKATLLPDYEVNKELKGPCIDCDHEMLEKMFDRGPEVSV